MVVGDKKPVSVSTDSHRLSQVCAYVGIIYVRKAKNRPSDYSQSQCRGHSHILATSSICFVRGSAGFVFVQLNIL